MEKLRRAGPSPAQRNLEQLERLFPCAVTERRGADGTLERAVDFEALRRLFSPQITEGDERYAFTWAGKGEAAALAAQPTARTLRPLPEESRNWTATQNLYLQGDNLEALKILQESYLGKVGLLYLDPPYNTGRDFLYRDRFQHSQREEDRRAGAYAADGRRLFANRSGSGRFHSDWCSMLYPRLLLARNLLSEDGVVFLSVGDEEAANLRKICDEVFGEDNFRNQIAVRRGAKSVQAQFDTWDRLGQGFEYLLLYTKSSRHRFPKQERPLEERRPGSWNNHWRGTDRPTLRYPLLGVTPASGQWRWSRERSQAAAENYRAMLEQLGRTEETVTQEEIDRWYQGQEEPVDLLRLSPAGKPEHYVPPARSALLSSDWTDLLVGSSREVQALFGAKVFDTPKLTSVIKRMLRFVPRDVLVLDLFSGSATTAQAVMECNAQDGGSRRFLLVQRPEPCGEKTEACRAGFRDICALGRERIRRAGDKLRREHPEADVDIGFRVFQVDESPLEDVRVLPEEVTQQVIAAMASPVRADRSELDLLYACLLSWGVEIHLPHACAAVEGCTVHTVDGGALTACFDRDVPLTVVRFMAEGRPRRALFREWAFPSDAAKFNVEEIFRMLSPNTKVKVIG